jgi:hypothetical protein
MRLERLNIRILPAARNELQLLGSFTCPKVRTWDRLFDFPSEGRHVEDFYIRKTRRLRPGLNPRTREPEATEAAGWWITLAFKNMSCHKYKYKHEICLFHGRENGQLDAKITVYE